MKNLGRWNKLEMPNMASTTLFAKKEKEINV